MEMEKFSDIVHGNKIAGFYSKELKKIGIYFHEYSRSLPWDNLG